MLSKRIIPCLDVKDSKVVKGVRFRNHAIVGDIVSLAKKYSDTGADELVFYDITASSDNKVVDKSWIKKIARVIDIPFCVAGGISSIKDAKEVLSSGADKISINSPALSNPNLINELSDKFGIQCIVIGIDSYYDERDNSYKVYQFTGSENKTIKTSWDTLSWVKNVQERGAGEIVLNTINQDGLCNGYDLLQLKKVRDICKVPLIASGGAGNMKHFKDVFIDVNVDGALAASVFHKDILNISDLKQYLKSNNIIVRE